jgi:hypothetical protein
VSRIFGEIRQNGYVVSDLDQAMWHWINVLGVGPFFRFSCSFDSYIYRGEPSDPKLEIAIANAGFLQIELIQQVNAARSSYKDFLEMHGAGLQHIAVWTETYESDLIRWANLGYQVDCECKMAKKGRVTFYRTELHGGTLIEVLEYLPAARKRMEFVRQASVGWDGSNPVRSLGIAVEPAL